MDTAQIIAAAAGAVLVVGVPAYKKWRASKQTAAAHPAGDADLEAQFQRRIHQLRLMAPVLQNEQAKNVLDLCEELKCECEKGFQADNQPPSSKPVTEVAAPPA